MEKKMKQFGAIMHGHAGGILEQVFAGDYIHLSAHDQRLIRQDFMETSDEIGIGAREYARRIGAGNLQAYADVMRVRERNGWSLVSGGDAGANRGEVK